MADIIPLSLDGCFEIRPRQHGDERGFFSETWNEGTLREKGLEFDFVQDNHSLSRERHVLRGLHFQTPPFAQAKLVRVAKGAILDVAVDLRSDSFTFGQWLSLEVSAERWNQILVPRGFAHGFLTLEPDTEVIYKVDAPYSRECDRSIRFDDPAIGIDWTLGTEEPVLSQKDANAPLLADVETGF